MPSDASCAPSELFALRLQQPARVFATTGTLPTQGCISRGGDKGTRPLNMIIGGHSLAAAAAAWWQRRTST